MIWISGPLCMLIKHNAWRRHQMETFSALLAICAGNSPVPGEFPTQRPVTRSFDVFFDLRLNKRLSKQSWGWWFETISRPLWRHRNGEPFWIIDRLWDCHYDNLCRKIWHHDNPRFPYYWFSVDALMFLYTVQQYMKYESYNTTSLALSNSSYCR